MATISIAGTVTGKAGESAVTLKTFPSRFPGSDGDTVATFSVADRAYVYAKQGEERQGQFYRVEVRGKAAEICSERIKRGDKIAVSGQLVQRTYQDKLFLDVKNASVTFLDEGQGGGGQAQTQGGVQARRGARPAPVEDELPF
jgi:single-stranded DNA-binding protein